MLRAGDRFAHYEIEDFAGAGGTAVVYRARDTRLGRLVALKLIGAPMAVDPLVRERLNREAMLAAAVDHPNVVPIFDAGERDGTIFLARRWIDGMTLGQLVEREAPLAVGRVASLLVQIAHALQAVHDADLIHRDVTPGNVLVDVRDRAHLTDFGITRHATEVTGLTAPGQLLATLDYVAPEQIAGGEVGRLADIYSLGCLGWFLLCGEAPFPRDGHAAKLYAHLSADYVPVGERRDDVPEALDALLGRAMAKEPGRRPASAAAFADEVVRAATGLGDAMPLAPAADRPVLDLGRAEPSPPRRPRGAGRRGLAVGVLAGAVLAAAPPLLYAALADHGAGSQTLSLGRPAASVTAGPGGVLVGGGATRSVTVVSPRDGRHVLLLGAPADRIAAGGNRVYVAGGRELTVLGAGSARPARRVPLPARLTALTADGHGAWLALTGRSALVHVAGGRSTLAPSAGRLSALQASGDVLWAVSRSAGTVQRLSAVTGRPLGPAVRAARAPVGIAVTAHTVWLLDAARNAVLPLDPRTGRVSGAPVPVPPHPVAIAADDRAVWVVSAGANVATRIDPRSGRPAQTEGVPAGPTSVVVVKGSAWVAAAAGRLSHLPLR